MPKYFERTQEFKFGRLMNFLKRKGVNIKGLNDVTDYFNLILGIAFAESKLEAIKKLLKAVYLNYLRDEIRHSFPTLERIDPIFRDSCELNKFLVYSCTDSRNINKETYISLSEAFFSTNWSILLFSIKDKQKKSISPTIFRMDLLLYLTLSYIYSFYSKMKIFGDSGSPIYIPIILPILNKDDLDIQTNKLKTYLSIFNDSEEKPINGQLENTFITNIFKLKEILLNVDVEPIFDIWIILGTNLKKGILKKIKSSLDSIVPSDVISRYVFITPFDKFFLHKFSAASELEPGDAKIIDLTSFRKNDIHNAILSFLAATRKQLLDNPKYKFLLNEAISLIFNDSVFLNPVYFFTLSKILLDYDEDIFEKYMDLNTFRFAVELKREVLKELYKVPPDESLIENNPFLYRIQFFNEKLDLPKFCRIPFHIFVDFENQKSFIISKEIKELAKNMLNYKSEAPQILYIFGRPAKGKTTVSSYLAYYLFKLGYIPFYLDGRKNPNLQKEIEKIKTVYEKIKPSSFCFATCGLVLVVDNAYLFSNEDLKQHILENERLFSKIIIIDNSRKAIKTKIFDKSYRRSSEVFIYDIEKEYFNKIYNALIHRFVENLPVSPNKKNNLFGVVKKLLKDISRRAPMNNICIIADLLYEKIKNSENPEADIVNLDLLEAHEKFLENNVLDKLKDSFGSFEKSILLGIVHSIFYVSYISSKYNVSIPEDFLLEYSKELVTKFFLDESIISENIEKYDYFIRSVFNVLVECSILEKIPGYLYKSKKDNVILASYLAANDDIFLLLKKEFGIGDNVDNDFFMKLLSKYPYRFPQVFFTIFRSSSQKKNIPLLFLQQLLDEFNSTLSKKLFRQIEIRKLNLKSSIMILKKLLYLFSDVYLELNDFRKSQVNLNLKAKYSQIQRKLIVAIDKTLSFIRRNLTLFYREIKLDLEFFRVIFLIIYELNLRNIEAVSFLNDFIFYKYNELDNIYKAFYSLREDNFGEYKDDLKEILRYIKKINLGCYNLLISIISRITEFDKDEILSKLCMSEEHIHYKKANYLSERTRKRLQTLLLKTLYPARRIEHIPEIDELKNDFLDFIQSSDENSVKELGRKINLILECILLMLKLNLLNDLEKRKLLDDVRSLLTKFDKLDIGTYEKISMNLLRITIILDGSLLPPLFLGSVINLLHDFLNKAKYCKQCRGLVLSLGRVTEITVLFSKFIEKTNFLSVFDSQVMSDKVYQILITLSDLFLKNISMHADLFYLVYLPKFFSSYQRVFSSQNLFIPQDILDKLYDILKNIYTRVYESLDAKQVCEEILSHNISINTLTENLFLFNKVNKISTTNLHFEDLGADLANLVIDCLKDNYQILDHYDLYSCFKLFFAVYPFAKSRNRIADVRMILENVFKLLLANKNALKVLPPYILQTLLSMCKPYDLRIDSVFKSKSDIAIFIETYTRIHECDGKHGKHGSFKIALQKKLLNCFV